MILRTAYVRFYRAFNFDYLRKHHRNAHPDLWDMMPDSTFYPYVRLDLEPSVTAIVGANESGKSQFLDAIECALGYKIPTPADFCRYSDYFTVSQEMRTPHFGLQFQDLSLEDSDIIAEAMEDSDAPPSSFHLFREATDTIKLYANGKAYSDIDMESITSILPRVFRIDPKRAIPNSVPISFLLSSLSRDSTSMVRRADRWRIVDPIVQDAEYLLHNVNDSTALAGRFQSMFPQGTSPIQMSVAEQQAYQNQLTLASELLITVGGIDVSAFQQLELALRNDDEGLANGIVARMNAQLERSLNLAKWWSQDHQFRLGITVRDFDIVFTIRDRTGTEYSFAERSDGLKYFLSYLVQFLAHVRDRSKPELLLMDEPDAFLSNRGQQDLLRVLHDFTLPTADAPGGQVVYVTHSPFLIDKNRGDRIRVLDKGSRDEGVRVVHDVGRNHFEPLRTALGGFVGETAFIGNCNLMLEGLTDQIYLAGMSELLDKAKYASTERLDLNRITLVPAGSASHVPYMTFLARGRDTNKPAVIVLLDGDQEGTRAVQDLKRGGPRQKKLIRDEYVMQLTPGTPGLTSDRPGGPLEVEDLIPIDLAVEAALNYLKQMEIPVPIGFPEVATIKDSLSVSTGVFEATQQALAQAGSKLHLEKLGFARHVLDLCATTDSTVVHKLQARFAALFSILSAMQRKAEREQEQDSIASRVNREKTLFFQDHPSTATKADVAVLLERIEDVIDISIEGDTLLAEIRRIRDAMELGQDLNTLIEVNDKLKVRLERLRYAEILASQSQSAERQATGISADSENGEEILVLPEAVVEVEDGHAAHNVSQ